MSTQPQEGLSRERAVGQEATTEARSMREQRLTHEAGGTGKAELTQKEETLRPGRRRWPAALTNAVTVKAAPEDMPLEATGDRR